MGSARRPKCPVSGGGIGAGLCVHHCTEANSVSGGVALSGRRQPMDLKMKACAAFCQ